MTAFSIEGEGPTDTSHLAKQDIATLDPAKLTPLSPEIISRQATINIGTIGHVAHGKSTVVKAISGVQVILMLYFPLSALCRHCTHLLLSEIVFKDIARLLTFYSLYFFIH